MNNLTKKKTSPKKQALFLAQQMLSPSAAFNLDKEMSSFDPDLRLFSTPHKKRALKIKFKR